MSSGRNTNTITTSGNKRKMPPTTDNNDNNDKNNNNKDPEEQQQQQPDLTTVSGLLQRAQLLSNAPSSSPPFVHVTKLDVGGAGLSCLPDGFAAALPQLSILFLSNNQFEEMPAVLGDCLQLQMVAFRGNGMRRIHPDALQVQLRWLILTNNLLETLPSEIGRCTRLQKCMLSGNRLRELPATMSQCRNLELLRLASNQLQAPPMHVLQLPKLAWIALADNPFLETLTQNNLAAAQAMLTASNNNNNNDTAAAAAAAAAAPLLPVLSHIIPTTDDVVLGKGAGGVTRQVWDSQAKTWVAVKEYADTMTSDGKPSTERILSCVVGLASSTSETSNSLVRVRGQTTEGALVMEFLENFVPLAQPPSLESCSRDVYSSTKRGYEKLTRSQAETLVTRLLEALRRLHAAGISHGDFYGHNILVQSTQPTNVRLTDLGAAYWYTTLTTTTTTTTPLDLEFVTWVQRVELRAFAILVAEVIQELLVEAEQSASLESLVQYCHELAVENAQDAAAATGNAKDENSPSSLFDTVYVWWKQQQLASLAKAFVSDDDNVAPAPGES